MQISFAALSTPSASQALLRLVPTSANVHPTVTVSAAGTAQAQAAAPRSASVSSTGLRPPLPSLAVAAGSLAAATPQRRTSSAAAATVTAGPTASAPVAAAPQEAARHAAANILRGAIVLDTGFAVTCLAHQAYRDGLARGSGWAASQQLYQQLGRKGTSDSDATSDSVVDRRLRLVWAVDEHSRCTQRAALEVLASVLPRRQVCGYYSRFDNTRCVFRSESQLVLERHRRTAHVDAGGRLACARCDFTVRSAGHFHQHCSASHGDDGVHEAPTKTFCCPVCDYETAHSNRAQKHVERCVPAFDETHNLQPSEVALISSCVAARDCRPTVADVLAEAHTAAALSQTVVATSGLVRREVVVKPRPYVGIAIGQHQPSIVMRPLGGGMSLKFTVTKGQQLSLQHRGLAGTSLMAAQTPRAPAPARPLPGLPTSVVAQGDISSPAAVVAAAAVSQQPVVRLTARPTVLLRPSSISRAAGSQRR